MTDFAMPSLVGGSFEEWSEWLKQHRVNLDAQRIRAGIALLGLEKRYGSGTIERLARETAHGRSTLSEWRKVAEFLLRWRGQLSAVRIFEDFDGLAYSHIRIGRTLPDVEDAIEALLSVVDETHAVAAPERKEGETPRATRRREFLEEYGRTPRPVTVDHFKEYIHVLKDGQPPPKPLLDCECRTLDEALELARQQREKFQGKRLRMIIREVK